MARSTSAYVQPHVAPQINFQGVPVVTVNHISLFAGRLLYFMLYQNQLLHLLGELDVFEEFGPQTDLETRKILNRRPQELGKKL